MSRSRWVQCGFLAGAAVALVIAGLLMGRLDAAGEEYELVAPGDVVAQKYPQLTLLTTTFGGLRAPVVAYLWIKAEQQKQDGRLHDAMQLAELICHLQPRFPGVWSFQYWNMAWNMSVKTHTTEERWLWVTNGMKLLRDRGIPYNPRSLLLYKDLAWLFYSKMGGHTDEMHMVYKQRWADEMQALLGAPPFGTTPQVIDAFRPVAEAPLDRRLGRQGASEIQPDKLDQLFARWPSVGDYARELQRRADAGERELIDFLSEDLLDLYNRWSLEEAAAVARRRPPQAGSPGDQAVYEWINDAGRAEDLSRLLAFVRAQKLWNQYRMDPAWMLSLMERLNVPLDWRMCRAHGLYWTSYGLHVCKDLPVGEIDSVNTDRILLFSLRDMCFYGRLIHVPDPEDAEGMRITHLSDWRFFEPAHQEHLRWAEMVRKARGKDFDENIFRSGHVNFLVAVIKMLYAGGPETRQQAREYLNWIKENYDLKGPSWELPLDDFVRNELWKDGSPILSVTVSQITAALQAAYRYVLEGDTQRATDYMRHGLYVYDAYMRDAARRLRLPEFSVYQTQVLRWMLVRPEAIGAELNLLDRVQLYDRLNDGGSGSGMLARLYDDVAPRLRRLCEREGIAFETAFPPPRGLQEYREALDRPAVPTD